MQKIRNNMIFQIMSKTIVASLDTVTADIFASCSLSTNAFKHVYLGPVSYSNSQEQ